MVTQTDLFRAPVPTNGIDDLVGYTYAGAPAGNLAGAEALVTGNLRHFPEPLRRGVVVSTPKEFVDTLR